MSIFRDMLAPMAKRDFEKCVDNELIVYCVHCDSEFMESDVAEDDDFDANCPLCGNDWLEV